MNNAEFDAGCMLYVVDGSVLPRSSRVNPSLTIFARALPTADLLVRARVQQDELHAARSKTAVGEPA